MMRQLHPRTFRPLLRTEEGASSVEFAIVFPFFFLFMIAIFEFARACYSANTLQFGVAQGARYVMVHQPTYSACCPDTGQCTSSYSGMASAITSNLGLPGVSIAAAGTSPTCSASQPSMQITVTGTYQFNFFLSSGTTAQIGLGSTGILMSQQAVVQIPLN
jgi:Flp pilus assembly protein TadG